MTIRRGWRRWLLVVLAAVAALAAATFAALWIGIRVAGPSRLERLVETAGSRFLQRTLTIERVELAPFPALQVRAFGVQLSGSDGRVVARSPSVTARASVLSVLKLRLGVDEIRFENPQIDLWYEPDGRLNVEHIVADVRARPGEAARRSIGSLLYHRFTVTGGRLRLLDSPAAAPLVDGKVSGHLVVTLSPFGLRGFPFEVSVDEGDNGVFVRASGTMGALPSVSVRGTRVPARALAPRVPQIADCAGRADLRLDWSGGRNGEIDFSVSPHNLCGGAAPERVSGHARRARGGWDVRLSASGADTRLSATGRIPPAGKAIEWTADAESADVDALVSWWSASRAVMARSGGDPDDTAAREVNVRAAASTVTWRNVTAHDAAFSLHRSTSGDIRVDPASMRVFGGTMTGTVEIRDGAVFLDWRGNDLSIGELNAALSSTAALTGRMAIQMDGYFPVGSPPVPAFAGQAQVWVKDFELERVPAILRSLTSANFARIERKLKGEKGGKFPPASGSAQADLRGGVAHVNRLVLENQVLKVGYSGEVRYADRRLDGTTVLQALTAADQIINDIPILRDLVLGDGKSFLPLWFKVTGPWDDPHVRPMPARSLATPVWEIFKRALELPQDAIDKLRGKR